MNIEHFRIDAVRPSPWNTRTVMDDAELDALTEDIKANGINTPLIVRKRETNGDVWYEIAAGHRRHRVAMRLELDALPCIVRELSDVEFLRLLGTDNDQREEVHPLDEAAYYERMRVAVQDEGRRGDLRDVAKLVSRPFLYVYNRHRLTKLAGDLQEHFRKGRITLGHAILLSRLTPEQQKDAQEDERSGLWQRDGSEQPTDLFDGVDRSVDKDDDHGDRKPCSVGELKNWIDRNIRFMPEADETAAVLFPETTDAYATARAKSKTRGVVWISRLTQLLPNAKDPSGKRTYGVMSWRRADGKGEANRYTGETDKPSKTCDKSVLGIVAAGPGRGESFSVCVARDKCKVHYGKEIREKEKRQKEREAAGTGGTAGAVARAARSLGGGQSHEDYERQRQEQVRENTRWSVAMDAVTVAIVERMTAGAADSTLVRQILRDTFHCLDHTDTAMIEQWRALPQLSVFVVPDAEWTEYQEKHQGDEDSFYEALFHQAMNRWIAVTTGASTNVLAALRAYYAAKFVSNFRRWEATNGKYDMLVKELVGGQTLSERASAVTDEQVAAYLQAERERDEREQREQPDELWEDEGDEVEGPLDDEEALEEEGLADGESPEVPDDE